MAPSWANVGWRVSVGTGWDLREEGQDSGGVGV